MKLTEQLRELAEGSTQRHPGSAQKIMGAAIKALQETPILEKAAKTGDQLPHMELINAAGDATSLKALLQESRLVIAFYRGGWCPYCNLELRALQEIVPQIEAKNAKLVAISPELPDNSLTTSEKNAIHFTVLSDVNNSLARALGLVYQLPDDLVNLYKTFKIDLNQSQGNTANELPIAATYVVEQDGTISYHFLEEDYKLRADPETILAAL